MNSSQSAQFIANIKQIENKFTFYCTLFVVIPGIAMNFANTLVFSQKEFKKSIRYLFTCLSIIDIFNLTVCVLLFFPQTLDELNQLSIKSNLICKCTAIALRFFTQASSWLQVLISFDRVFSATYPIKYKSQFGTKYVMIALPTLLTILLAASFSNLTFELNQRQTNFNNQTPLFSCLPPRSVGLALNISGILIRALVPFSLMFTFNSLLIYIIFKKKVQHLNKTTNRKEYNLAFTIIGMNYLFLLLNMPLTVLQINEYVVTITNPDQRALVNLLQKISTYLMYLYSAFTFLYYLKFNFIFKRVFYKLTRKIIISGLSTFP
jgi:hypothetical protein